MTATGVVSAQEVVDLGPGFESARLEGNLPALAALVTTPERVLAQGAIGVRKQGDETQVTFADLWHVGSITKSFTSTLFARLVEGGKLDWDHRLDSVLPEAQDTPYAAVTFAQLLGHTSGLAANPSFTVLAQSRSWQENLPEQRRKVVAEVLALEPESEPGEKFLYSNSGYIVVGAALERLTGSPWEELVREHVLDPLDLLSAGFGSPGVAGKVEQPYGHRYTGTKSPPQPINPGPFADNPAMLGPAGTLHMSLADLGVYLAEHLRGENGQGRLLRHQSYQRLHHGVVDDYGAGWVDQRPEWADGRRVIWHNGSNTMWYAVIAFVPELDLGFAVVTNGGITGADTVEKTLRQLYRDWSER